MTSSNDYLLKADNYAIAAQTVDSLVLRLRFIRASAMCRNKGLRMMLGSRAAVLRRCPYTRDELKAL